VLAMLMLMVVAVVVAQSVQAEAHREMAAWAPTFLLVHLVPSTGSTGHATNLCSKAQCCLSCCAQRDPPQVQQHGCTQQRQWHQAKGVSQRVVV